ncbi:MAG: DUF3298 domain-containing protein [Proteobacteria bacterium]|nr:DUF3298 domain-containing protein [Pseudomonadota bacterium]
MSAMKHRGLWIGLVALVLVGVVAGGWWLMQPEAPAPKGPGGPIAEPATQQPATAAAVPYIWHSKTKLAETELKLPQTLAAEPELHARLFTQGVHELKGFAEAAAEARAEEGDTANGMPPLSKTMTWTAAADTSKLLSLKRETFEYSGGAHPLTTLDSLLWDKALKKPLQPQALLRKGADTGKLDTALCQAVTDAKKARLGKDFSPAGDDWVCPKWTETAVALAPSSTPGKAGGVTFLFSPSAVGAYAEGPYLITLPQSAFRWAISPAYLDEFAGAPPKVGDVTPKP